MKVALISVVVAVSIVVTSAAWSCFTDKERCQENKCCVQVGNLPLGVCKEIGEEGDKCSVHPLTVPLFDHVHIIRCKCNEGLKCVAKDGIVGKLLGTCQKESDEEPEPKEE